MLKLVIAIALGIVLAVLLIQHLVVHVR